MGDIFRSRSYLLRKLSNLKRNLKPLYAKQI